MKLPSAVADIVRTIAPTVAAALSGPFAPLAAGIVTAALRQWLPAEVAPERKATPVEVVQAVQEHASDQKLMYDLQKAELDLLRYEQEIGFRFADLEVRDREGARTATRESGLARSQFVAGMTLVTLSLLMLFGVIIGSVMAVTGNLSIDPAQSQIAIAAFGLIGTVVGIFQGLTIQVIGFYFGSSAGSKEKNDQISGALQDMGQALADNAKSKPPAPAPAPPVVVVPPSPAPVEPAPAVPEGEWRQGPYGGVRWRQTAKGVIREETTEPMRTVGQPATVRRIWKAYGPLIAASCVKHAVPLELVVATIAQESGGKAKAILVEPDKRMSVGLMQTLTSTAEEMLGRRLSIEDLNDPATSIEAGTSYIAHQRAISEYQVPLVAAAYNSGGLHPPRAQDNNPWRLRSTGDHISRVCSFFGDALFVAEEDGWSHAEAEKMAA